MFVGGGAAVDGYVVMGSEGGENGGADFVDDVAVFGDDVGADEDEVGGGDEEEADHVGDEGGWDFELEESFCGHSAGKVWASFHDDDGKVIALEFCPGKIVDYCF